MHQYQLENSNPWISQAYQVTPSVEKYSTYKALE
jgi:hypothetical protein